MRILLSFFMSMCFFTSLHAASAPMTLFAYQNKANSVGSLADTMANTMAKPVTINKSLKSVVVGQQMDVELPNGERISLTVTSKSKRPNRTMVILASGSGDTQMRLTLGKKTCFGSITQGKLRFSVGFNPDAGQFVVDHQSPEFKSLTLENDMRFPPRAEQTQNSAPADTSAQDIEQGIQQDKEETEKQKAFFITADITLLAVYSTEFAAGFGDPVARIQAAVDFTNQALSSTGIEAQFRLVATQEIDFSNDLGVSTLLDQATFGTGAFSALPELRNTVGADMVSVLSFRGDFAANGVAWVNGDNPDFAFSSTRLSPFCCDSVFAHELGHNLGSGHERASVNNSPAGSCDAGFQPGGFNGFSCGHGVAGNFSTIMSRNIGTSIDRFSNPNQSCNGLPCGVPQGQANAADNFTSFNISSLLIEQFRPNVFIPNGVIISPILPLLLDDEE